MIGQARRIVLSYGRFDQFDMRETDFLRQAMALGDELIVGCTTDALSAAHGMLCSRDFEQRKMMLERCRYVDRVIMLDDLDQIRTDIVNYNAAVLVIGPEGYTSPRNVQDIAQIYDLQMTKTNKMPLKWTG